MRSDHPMPTECNFLHTLIVGGKTDCIFVNIGAQSAIYNNFLHQFIYTFGLCTKSPIDIMSLIFSSGPCQDGCKAKGQIGFLTQSCSVGRLLNFRRRESLCERKGHTSHYIICMIQGRRNTIFSSILLPSYSGQSSSGERSYQKLEYWNLLVDFNLPYLVKLGLGL